MDTMQAQCILLFIGFMTEVDGKCHINKQDTRLDFFTVQGAISKWHDRGGVVEFLPKPSLVEQWCKMKIAHLEEYKRKPIKEQYPEKPIINVKSELLQIVTQVSDGRVMLASLPGIGEKAAGVLYEKFEGDVASALCWLTDPDCVIKGIGTKTVENVRKFMGIDSIMVLELATSERLIEEERKRKQT